MKEIKETYFFREVLFVLGLVTFLVSVTLLMHRHFFVFPPIDAILTVLNSEAIDFLGALTGFLTMVYSFEPKINVKIISWCIVFINMFLTFISLTSLFHFLFADHDKPKMLITSVALFGMIAIGLIIARNLPTKNIK